MPEPKIDIGRIITLSPDDLSYYPVRIADDAQFGFVPNIREAGFPTSEIRLLPPQRNITAEGEIPAEAFRKFLQTELLMATFFDKRQDIFYVVSPLEYHNHGTHGELNCAYQAALRVPTI